MRVDKSKMRAKPGAEADSSSVRVAGDDDDRSGRVQFDDRGNAIWEWARSTGAFGGEIAAERLKKLDNPTLSLADDSPSPYHTVRANPLGTKKGYDPYDSGKLGKRAGLARKKDLRRLSEVLLLQKQAAENKGKDEDGEE